MNEDSLRHSPSPWHLNSLTSPVGRLQSGSPILSRNGSRMSISSKSNTGGTFNGFYNITSGHYTLKAYPSLLPYRVIEALSGSSLILKNLSVRISVSGWAWLVSGRRLFVWHYLEDEQAIFAGKPKASKCYELSLPSSDISHKAELICVLSRFEHKSKFPSALAISPEGAIRYWPNVSQENNAIDSVVAADLQGQECLMLVDIQPLGCILGTTTNSLVHIILESNRSQASHTPIICRTLKTPQGLLSGISRKVSSFIFGSLPTAHSTDFRQLVRIVTNNVDNDNDDLLPRYILALSNCLIQKWSIDDLDSENMIAEIDLERHIKEAFISKLWNRTTTDHSQLTLRPLDIALKSSNDVLLLVMCTNSDICNERYFGLFTLSDSVFTSIGEGSTTWPGTGSIFKCFTLLSNVSIVENEHMQSDSRVESLVPNQLQQLNILSGNVDEDKVCYIYNSHKLYRINQCQNGDNTMEDIDFQLCADYLLGAVVVNQTPLLLTFKNGFISIHTIQTDNNFTKQLSAVDREYVNANNLDKFSVLKRALQLYIKGEKIRSELMVKELFPSIESNHSHSAELDDVVCALSGHILDQIPQRDPRWAQLTSSDANDANEEEDSINHVIIANQLEEKLTTHRLFIELLQKSGAWKSLASLTTSISIIPSKLVLCEHTEKLIVTFHLHKIQSKYDQIMGAAISKSLQKRSIDCNFAQQAHLSKQDLFYREVTKVDELFWSLIELENDMFNLELTNQSGTFETVLSVANIMVHTFGEVCLYRKNNGSLYQSAAVSDCDYVPWSTAEHLTGVRDALLQQFEFLVKLIGLDQKAFFATNQESKCKLVAQRMVELADIILDSYVSQLAYLNENSEKYTVLKSTFQSHRYRCLSQLLRLKQYERAASLGEKYEDFDILISICEELNNQEQLQQYMARFANKGFSEHLFEWYLREGKQGKMLASVSNNYKLTDFLSNHESINWLHQIHLGQYNEASDTLKKLALLENLIPERRKTLLSLGKLALIASGNGHDYSDFDDQIKFLRYHEQLSDTLLSKNKLDRKSLKVLSPNELIDILTSGVEGPNQELDNFKQALEIAGIIEKRFSPSAYQQAIVTIWRRAFIKDDWQDLTTDYYETPIRKSFFYQLASIYFGDGPKKLPPLDELVASLDENINNEKIDFFLHAMYELLQAV